MGIVMMFLGFSFSIIISRTHAHTHCSSILKWCVKRDVWIVRVDRGGTIPPLYSVSVWLPRRWLWWRRTVSFGLRGLGAQAGPELLVTDPLCPPRLRGAAIIPQ